MQNSTEGGHRYEQAQKKNTNRLNFSIDYSSAVGASHGRNSPRLEHLLSDNSAATGGGMVMSTNRLLRSMALSNPVSPERQQKAEERYQHSSHIWQSTSRYIKEKTKQKGNPSLIDQQSLHNVTREEFFTPTESNHGKPLFLARKG